jgi:hypothetical protein
LGVKDVIKDENVMRQNFGDQELLLSYTDRIRDDSKASFKAKDMETLAFHMITMPDMVELV